MKTASIVCLLSCCAALLAGWPVMELSLPGRSVGAAEASQLTGGQCVEVIQLDCGEYLGCRDQAKSYCVDAGTGSKSVYGDACTTNCNIWKRMVNCSRGI